MAGVIAAGSKESTLAGVLMLEMGGNAVDAAVAATFASFVAEHMVVNITGGGFCLLSDRSETVAYDFFTSVPSKGIPANYDFHRVEVDYGEDKQPFYIGRAATAVPGVMAGLCQVAAEKGRLPLETLMAPAIELAKNGFEVSPYFAYVLSMLAPIFSFTPEVKRMFGTQDRLFHAGDFAYFPKLADTLTELSKGGTELFYRGKFARMLVEEHRAHGGRIAYEDLANYQVYRNKPVRVSYHQHEVQLPPPCSQGGILIGFALRLLEPHRFAHFGHNSAGHLRALAYVMRLSNRAREAWDRLSPSEQRPDYFLSDDFLAPYRAALADSLAGIADPPDGAQSRKGAGNTSHISAMDDQGLAVAITTTAGESAGYTLGDTGLCLNNILGEEDLNPNGFHIQPTGDRMPSMMAPTLVCKNGRPILALGSAGSNRIRSAILQIICNVIDFGMPVADAIRAPRVHHENGSFHLELGVSDHVAQELREEGFKVNHWAKRNLFFGGVQATALTEEGLSGGADDRRGGSVASFP